MLRNIVQNSTKCGLLSLPSLFGEDKLDNTTQTEKSADISVTEKETGWDRVKRVFEVDEFGNLTHEANAILQVGAMSTFIGALYGGVVTSRGAYLEFMQNNQATTFRTHLEAKQKLQDKVTITFAKGAIRWGWRVTLFSTTFVGICTVIQAYRGKYGISEYVAAGGLTGAMYKFNMGPRGWLVGGGLGSALGLVCGCVTVGLLSLAGISMEEARYWQYHWKESREEYLRKGRADYLEKEDFAVIKLHNDEIGEAGKDISNLDKNVNSSKSVTDCSNNNNQSINKK